MAEVVWKRFKHLPHGAYHAFSNGDELEGVCGRNVTNVVVNDVRSVLVLPETDDFNKCKNCVYILDGTLFIARLKAPGGGMLHR